MSSAVFKYSTTHWCYLLDIYEMNRRNIFRAFLFTCCILNLNSVIDTMDVCIGVCVCSAFSISSKHVFDDFEVFALES